MPPDYPPPHYDEPRRAEQLRLIGEQPLSTFIVAGDGGQPYATPLPLTWARAAVGGAPLPPGHEELLGHLDAANPAAAWVRDGRRAIAVFHGPSAYISPRDYVSRQLPTYNYRQVHAHGTLRRVSDPAAVAADLRALVEAMEGPEGWELRADDARVPALIPGVVAFRLRVERLDGRYKLSQDKRPADRAAADAKLAGASGALPHSGARV